MHRAVRGGYLFVGGVESSVREAGQGREEGREVHRVPRCSAAPSRTLRDLSSIRPAQIPLNPITHHPTCAFLFPFFLLPIPSPSR